jgi:hypothetical protein
MGYGIVIDRMLFTPHMALGLKGMMYNDFQSVTATEMELSLRLYLIKIGDGGPFAQLGWGAAFYREDEHDRSAMVLDGVLGYRLYFFKGFYVDPFIRVGYPFVVSGGIMAGHWFNF